MIRSTERARQLVADALELGHDRQVILPVQASNDLVDTLRRTGAQVRYDLRSPKLESNSTSESSNEGDVLWDQPMISSQSASSATNIQVVDFGHTLPNTGSAAAMNEENSVIIWGLHLSDDDRTNGAVIVFGPGKMGEKCETRVRSLLTAADLVDNSRAMAQLKRLSPLVANQTGALQSVWSGLNQAAGLPLISDHDVVAGSGLAWGVPIRIPDIIDAATFYAYVNREGTPIEWLPLSHPIHHRVLPAHGAHFARQAGAELSRWIVVPVGPEQTNEETIHAVLGIVKAAEYLGLRWYSDPEKAAWYGELMNEWYGPDHDAYRPIFL